MAEDTKTRKVRSDKGVPRGPRVPREPVYDEPPPPVWVRGKMRDGSDFKFECWDFNVLAVGPWKFMSWAERRGRKVMRLLNPEEVREIEIEAPEDHFSRPAAPRSPIDAGPAPDMPSPPSVAPGGPRE